MPISNTFDPRPFAEAQAQNIANASSMGGNFNDAFSSGIKNFATAVDTHQKAALTLQQIRASQDQHDKAVQDLDLDKQQKMLDLEKAKASGRLTNVQIQMMEEAVKQSTKPQEDVLDAHQTLRDQAEHDTTAQLAQSQAIMKNLYQTDPVVQDNIHSVLANIMPMTGGAVDSGAMSRLPNIPMGGQVLSSMPPAQGFVPPQQPSQDDQGGAIAPQPDASMVPTTSAPSWADRMQKMRDAGLDPEEMFKGSGVYVPKAITADQQTRLDMAKDKFDEQKQKQADTRFTLMDKNLDPSGFRQGALGQEKVKYDSGERLMQLLQQGKGQPGGLDSRQMVEAAISLQNMLSPGNASVAEVMSLVPTTAKGSIAKMQEWIDSNPHGSDQQKFADRLEETSVREMSTLQSQMDRTLISRIPSFKDLKSKDEDRYNEILQSKGLTQEKVDAFKKGGMAGLIKYNKENIFGGSEQPAAPQYKVGETRKINGVIYTRQEGGQWHQSR